MKLWASRNGFKTGPGHEPPFVAIGDLIAETDAG